ncbi:MAG: caspase family protein, partial [Bacteroidales bacterium]
KIAEKNFVDHVDYKNKIRPRLRGMPEHRRDIEIVRHAFTESFSGNTPGRMISDISALIQKHHVQSIVADQDHFIQIVGLVFEKRKLQYPVKYKDVRFERLSTANTVNETETTTQHRQDTELILARELTSLIEHANYYALLIGVNDYADPTINDLLEPMNDVNKFYSTLVTNYTFTNENVTVLKNPTRNKLIQTLDKLASEITEKDNLLVFYAGHGLWDEQLKKGFWFPSDASADNRSNWFSNADLRDYIGGIEARHTLLISDACFSGGIFKTREVFTGVTPATLELYKLPSRKAMTSGAMTNVPDKSVFIEYLIKRLDENTSYFLSAEQLFASFKLAVINNSSTSQVPQFGEIRETGDEGGDFLFIRKK